MVFLKPSVLRVQMHANKAQILSPVFITNIALHKHIWISFKEEVLNCDIIFYLLSKFQKYFFRTVLYFIL